MKMDYIWVSEAIFIIFSASVQRKKKKKNNEKLHKNPLYILKMLKDNKEKPNYPFMREK